jgi:uncharacterized protein (DUF433 family)
MARSAPVSVRLDPEAFAAAQELARRTARPLGAVVRELAAEALRMRQHPGIVFGGPPFDRRARVEGTGLDVWEAIAVYRSYGEDAAQTLRHLEHLSPRQLDAALRYARAHPDEIDRLIAENEAPAEAWERRYPHLAPLQAPQSERLPE